LFDQGPRDPGSCSFPSNQVIISSIYSLEHNAPNELIILRKFNLEAILCFCIDVLLLTNDRYKVLFEQGPWNLVGYSFEPLNVNHLIVNLNPGS